MSKRLSDNEPIVPVRVKLRLLFLMVTVFASVSVTLAIRRERLIDTWRPLHYSVEVSLDDRLQNIVNATAQINLIALKKLTIIDLDFGDMTTDSVTMNATPLEFEHKSGKLAIRLPKSVEAASRVTITITYHGKPKDGLILTNDKDGRPSAVGDNWPDRVHHWIPCFDHPSAKATVTFKVTAAAKELVVANGRLDHVETSAAGTRTWTYTESEPIPPYCMIIAVGDFSLIESPGPVLTPLSYYVPHTDANSASKGFSPATSVLQLFNKTVGPYPYEKLALIVGATRFGGMENSSAIVFASNLLNPKPEARLSETFRIPSGTVDVVAHEIAHQWFGDSVTESTWSDLWLSEGFATYFAGLFIQKTDGEAAFQAYMKQAAEAAFAYEKKNRIPIFDRNTEDLFKLLNPNNYQKGAWVLHMLRSQLGDGFFFQGIRNYYAAHKRSVATSEDLRAALEQASGKNLKTFFARWIYETGHPQYAVEWSWLKNRHLLVVSLTQKQSGSVFADPVPLFATTETGKQKFVIYPKGKNAKQVFSLREKPTAVELDPQNTLLREISQ